MVLDYILEGCSKHFPLCCICWYRTCDKKRKIEEVLCVENRTSLQTIELICKSGFSTRYWIRCTFEYILIKEKTYKYFLCTWGCDGDAVKLNFLSVLYVEITVHR